LSNKQIRKRILSFWKRHDYINFLDLLQILIFKKYGNRKELNFSKEKYTYRCRTENFGRYRFITQIPYSGDYELVVYYKPMIEIWKTIQLSNNSPQEIESFLDDSFLYKYKKQKFLKYIFLTSNQYVRCMILTKAVSFGLFDFLKYCNGISKLNIRQYTFFPETIEAFLFCERKQYNTIHYSELIILPNIDLSYIIFLHQKYNYIEDEICFENATITNNKQIARYILENTEEKSKFIISLDSIRSIDFFHKLGYSFTYQDLPDIFTMSSLVIQHCFTKYRHELFSETEDFKSINQKQVTCSCTKLSVNNQTTNQIILHTCIGNDDGNYFIEIVKK